MLELACGVIEPPSVVTAVLELAADETRWGEAHDAFQRVRKHALARRENDVLHDERVDALLDLAEKTAKVVYNASGSPAPFDHNAGWKIAPSLRRLITAIGDERFCRAARRALLMNRTEH
jgi:hypothetical protein